MEKQNEAIKLQFERMEQRLPTTEFCENIQRFVQETSSKCAELYAMCLKDREDINRIEKNLAVVYKLINTNKEHRIRVERTTTDLSTSVTTNAEHITQIHAEIAKLHNDINTINSTCSDNKKQLYVEITKARHHPELSRQGGPSADEIAEIKQQIQNIAKGLETVFQQQKTTTTRQQTVVLEEVRLNTKKESTLTSLSPLRMFSLWIPTGGKSTRTASLMILASRATNFIHRHGET